MEVISTTYVTQWYDTLAAVLPAVLGAIIVLLIGWVVGRLLGKGVRFVLDKIVADKILPHAKSVIPKEKSNLTLGYIGDVLTRLIVYLIAIVAAADILNMEVLSNLVTEVVKYIPHVVAFIAIFVVGFLLVDYFVDFLKRFYENQDIELINPVLLVFRVFLYLVVAILALSQLMLDLTIIYTFLTPIAWGIGLGLGAGIAVVIGYGLKNRSEEIMDRFIGRFQKK